MGTRYAVSVASGGRTANWSPNVQEVQRQVDERLAEINRLMSTYDPESELSRFNRLNSSDWFAVSPETAEVVAAALEIAERTSGAFDPTVGPVVNLWGFGPDKSRTELPTDEAITAALARVGYEEVSVRTDPPALKKAIPEVYLDLSGIAKGYASDAISELLDKLGLANTMVEIGGEVRTRGAKADGTPWRIGVEQPDDRERRIHAAVNLVNAGMATSGDYRNYFEHEGIRYSHTIDPATGRPVRHDLAAVSVVAPTCMEADALATAVLVMGDQKGYDWCVEHDVAAMFLVRQGEQIFERATPEFQKRIEPK
jgi:thiamine biosynthesis lipoprotein